MALVFNSHGMLPTGDVDLTITELRDSLLVVGDTTLDPYWDRAWRSQLVDNLAILCGHLRDEGITEIFADGSFVTSKPKPGDIDGYFLCDFNHFHQIQSPRLITRDDARDLQRRKLDAHGKMKPLMWHKYHIELFPQFLPPFDYLSPADVDRGRPILFSEFFRRARSGTSRGIVRINSEPRP
jgi:hypothetical protein